MLDAATDFPTGIDGRDPEVSSCLAASRGREATSACGVFGIPPRKRQLLHASVNGLGGDAPARSFTLPDCEAATSHVPAVIASSLPATIVQTAGVFDMTSTGRPLEL